VSVKHHHQRIVYVCGARMRNKLINLMNAILSDRIEGAIYIN